MGLFDKNMQYKADTRVTCPYCKTILDPPPNRKSKCPSCGKDIYVRTDPFNKQKIYYLKQDDALLLDVVRDMQISERAFTDAMNRAPKSLSLGDIVWGLIGQQKQEAARRGDWQTTSNITWKQARYLYEVKRGYFPILQAAMKEELQGELAQGFTTHVTISSSRDNRTCEKCKSQDGVTLTIQEALKTMPIPVKCDNEEGWCRCVYTYSIQR